MAAGAIGADWTVSGQRTTIFNTDMHVSCVCTIYSKMQFQPTIEHTARSYNFLWKSLQYCLLSKLFGYYVFPYIVML